MATITASEINKKINLLPENLLVQVDGFLNSLTSKQPEKDWFEELTEDQVKAIRRGEQDILEGRVHTHEEVRAKILAYRNRPKTN